MCCFDTLNVLKSKITYHWWVKIAHHFLLCSYVYVAYNCTIDLDILYGVTFIATVSSELIDMANYV